MCTNEYYAGLKKQSLTNKLTDNNLLTLGNKKNLKRLLTVCKVKSLFEIIEPSIFKAYNVFISYFIVSLMLREYTYRQHNFFLFYY